MEKQLYMTIKKELEQQKHSEKEWGAKCPLFLLSNPKTTRKNVIKGSSDCHYPRRPQTHHETSVTNYQVSYLGQTAETWTQDRVNTSERREITLPNTIDLRNTLLNGTQHNFIYITNEPNGTTKINDGSKLTKSRLHDNRLSPMANDITADQTVYTNLTLNLRLS